MVAKKANTGDFIDLGFNVLKTTKAPIVVSDQPKSLLLLRRSLKAGEILGKCLANLLYTLLALKNYINWVLAVGEMVVFIASTFLEATA